ncbi:MAG: hypothetical protein OXF27_11645 [Acidobacteria bacterium]|nr:hypothetical protein [Acidobacteriota bacterium]
MKRLAGLALTLLAALFVVETPATTARMPVDEIRRGMIGVGITVFEGSRREEFGVEILGVLRNALGPRRDIVVARLSGGPLADTGVVQGMSGSPVYIDGRLIGAVSYALGSFAKEPIAGITPIDEMVASDANRNPATRLARMPPPFPLTGDGLEALVGERSDRLAPFPLRSADVRTLGLPQWNRGNAGALLRPIATPVVLGGFEPQIQDLWIAALGAGGFAAAAVGGQTPQPLPAGALQPGDPVGAALVRGDLMMAATGTVTMVEDGRVYAFGHPFYNLGSIRFPMTRASVTTVLPSLALSSKIAAIGDTVGTLDQDRATGIFGTLGNGPRMVPVRMALDAPGQNLRQTFRFEVVEDRLFTPLLTYSGMLSTFLSWTRQLGASTYSVSSTTRVDGQDDVAFKDVYSGDTALIAAAGAVANPLSALLNTDIAAVDVEGVEISVTAAEEPRTAALERVWLDTARVRAGDTVGLRVLVRGYRGADLVETVDIEIPSNVTGSVRIQVSDAAALNASERLLGQPARAPRTVGQLIESLNTTRRGNRLYVKLLRSQPGAVVKGATMPALPASVLAVLESDRSGSGLHRLDQATLGEWEIETGHAVSGSRTLTVRVEDR